MKRQIKLALIDNEQLTLVGILAQELGFEYCWLVAEIIKQQLIDFKTTIIIIHIEHKLALDTDFTHWLIEHYISKIIIFEEQTNIDMLNNVLGQGNGDCLVAPVRKQDLSMAIQRCTLVSKLMEVNNHQFERLRKSNLQIKENNQILQSDLTAGRKLQKGLLPQSPCQFKQLHIEHLIIPSLYLSGDFINYKSVLGRFCLFLLTDVSGHGSASAFVTVMIKQMMERVIRRHIRYKDNEALCTSPQGFFELVNNYLLDNGIEKHVTGIAGMIDTEENVLRFTTAAHFPAPILVVNEEAQFLKHEGKPVGMFPNVEWTIEHLKMDTQFTLYCLSDGVYDVIKGDSMSQKDQFLLQQLAESEPSKQGVCESLGIDMEIEPPDDISILILHE